MRKLGPFLALALVTGCTALVDVDRFHEARGNEPGALRGSSQFSDFRFELVGMKPHLSHMFEFRVVDSNNFIQSRGIIDSMQTLDATFTMPRAVPKANGPYRLDFFADVNASGGYDGLGSVVSNDHAWRIDPLKDFPEETFPPVEGLVQVRFVHNTTFTNIDQWPSGTANKAKDTETPARLALNGLGPYVGKMLEVRVAEKTTGHVVGLYRTTSVQKDAISATIPGAVEAGADYDVTVYVDANGNGKYDKPGGDAADAAWKLSASAQPTGLQITFDPATAGDSNVDVGEP